MIGCVPTDEIFSENSNAPDKLKKQFQGVDEWSSQEADPEKIEEFKRNITKLDNWRKMYIKDYLGPVAEAYGL